MQACPIFFLYLSFLHLTFYLCAYLSVWFLILLFYLSLSLYLLTYVVRFRTQRALQLCGIRDSHRQGGQGLGMGQAEHAEVGKDDTGGGRQTGVVVGLAALRWSDTRIDKA